MYPNTALHNYYPVKDKNLVSDRVADIDTDSQAKKWVEVSKIEIAN